MEADVGVGRGTGFPPHHLQQVGRETILERSNARFGHPVRSSGAALLTFVDPESREMDRFSAPEHRSNVRLLDCKLTSDDEKPGGGFLPDIA